MAPGRSRPNPLLKSSEATSQPFDNPDADSAPGKPAGSSSSYRHMSLKQLATILNRDSNTGMKYLEQGMPAVERADRDRGITWVIDSADAIRWLEERVAKNVAEKLGSDMKSVTNDEAECRDWVARMIIREKDAAESVGMVAKISAILDLIRTGYVEFLLRMKSLPDTLAGSVDAKYSAIIRTKSEELIREAFNSLVAQEKIEALQRG